MKVAFCDLILNFLSLESYWPISTKSSPPVGGEEGWQLEGEDRILAVAGSLAEREETGVEERSTGSLTAILLELKRQPDPALRWLLCPRAMMTKLDKLLVSQLS